MGAGRPRGGPGHAQYWGIGTGDGGRWRRLPRDLEVDTKMGAALYTFVQYDLIWDPGRRRPQDLP